MGFSYFFTGDKNYPKNSVFDASIFSASKRSDHRSCTFVFEMLLNIIFCSVERIISGHFV